MKNIGPVLGFAVAATLFLSSGANAQFGGRPTLLPQQGGEAIYKGICQDCHMPDARGAVGAGMYPALAGNPKLEMGCSKMNVQELINTAIALIACDEDMRMNL